MATDNWEVTLEHVQTVLKAHGISSPERAEWYFANLDTQDVVDNLLHWKNYEERLVKGFSDIEEQLLKQGVLTGPRKFSDASDCDEPLTEDHLIVAGQPEADGGLFEGKLFHWRDCFFSNPDRANILDFCARMDCKVRIIPPFKAQY